MLLRLRICCAASVVTVLLSACSGAGPQSVGTTPQGSPGAIGPAAVSGRDALTIARRGDSFHATLPVQPSSLELVLPTPQTLTVTVTRKTIVFVASSDPKIATVSPNDGNVDEIRNGSGTATFTVTPRAAGKACIGLIDAQWMYAIVPVTVSPPRVGARKIYVVNSAGNTLTTYNADGSPATPTISGLNLPEGVAVDAAGKIYVSNSGNSTVTTYSADGTRTTPTITKGIDRPIGVAVDATGKIYVANNGNFTVTTYTADGSQSTPTISGLRVNFPLGVAVDAAGKIYVAAAGPEGSSNAITTYKADGSPTTPTITAGLADPFGVAVDAAGKIYVANYFGYPDGKGTLTTYNADGTPSTPTITAGLNGPIGVAVDAIGKIYIANFGASGIPGTVSTYNPDGSRSTPTITAGLNRPFGIAVR